MRNNIVYIAAVLLGLGLSSCSSMKGTSATNTETEKGLTGQKKMAFDETFFTGLSAKYAGDDKMAVVYFQQCLTLDENNAAVKYELSQLYTRLGNNAAAVEMAESVVEKDPSNTWYLENLARSYQSAKMFAKSAATYEKLLETNPNEISYYYELGASYLYANNTAGAIQTYENLKALIGYDNGLEEQLFKLYEHHGQNEKAEATMLELIERNPNEVRYVSLLAAFYKKNGETQKSIDLYENLKKNHPNDPYVKLALYEHYNDLGETEKAFNNLEEAFGSKEVNIDAKVGILLALMDLSLKDETIKKEVFELLDIMSKTHPDDAKTWAIYGDFLNANNEFERAREMFLRSIEIDNSKYQVWNQVLFIDSELNDSEAMLKHAQACKELFPNQVLPYYFLGVVSMQKEDYKRAIVELEQAKELAYGLKELEVQILGNLGDAYYQAGKYQEAWLAYDQSLRMNPSNDYVLNNYAYFLSVRGENLEDAEKMSKQTVDRNPNNATYLDTYGWILFNMGNYPEAVKYLELAKKNLSSPSGEVLEHLGDALFKAGNKAEAIANWKEAEKVGGGSDQLNRKIKEETL